MPRKLVVSTFSGASGLDLGLEASGLTIEVSQEFDPVAVNTLKKNNRRVVPGDIRELLRSDPMCRFLTALKHIFAVVGGPPCQSYSMMGKRLTINDYRGRLYESYALVVKALRPRFFVLENVKGLTMFPGLLELILEVFHKLSYRTVHGVLNAADYGAPQTRQRLVIIGSRDGENIELPNPTHVGRWRTFHDATHDIQDTGLCGKFSSPVVQLLRHVPEGGNWRDLPPRLQKKALGNASPKNGGLCGIMRRLAFDKPAPTLVTSPLQRATLLAHPVENRPLSVREYARVQGFPDTWEFCGSAMHQYRQIGNAVPLALGKAVGKVLCSL